MGLEDILGAPEPDDEKKMASNGVDELVMAPDPKAPSLSESPETTEPSESSAITADPTQNVNDTQVAPTNDNPLADADSNTIPTSPIASESVSSTSTSEQTNVKSDYDKATDLLFARLAPVGLGENLKIMIYGPPGGTKSSALNIDNCLIYNNDGGLASILAWHEKSGEPLAKNNIALPFTSFTQASMLIERLNGREKIEQVKNFEVFAVDTINKLADKILMINSKKRYNRLPESMKEASSPFQPEVDDYTQTNNEMFDWVEQLAGLKMNLVLVAHSRTTESKRFGTKIHPDFSEKLANKLEAMMDVVAYVEMQEDANGEASPVWRFITDGHIHAKNRIGLPNLASNVKYTDILARWEELKKLQANQ